MPIVFLLFSFLLPLVTDVNSSIEPESNSATILIKLFLTGFLMYLTLVRLFKNPLSSLTKRILLYSTYLLILAIFSGDFTTVTTRVLTVSGYFLLLPASTIIFRNKNYRKLFFNSLLLINVLAILYIVYASAFNIGAVIYEDEILRYGGFHFFGLYLFVFSLPLFLDRISKKNDIFIVLIIIAQIVIIILSLKRTYLLLTGLFILSFLVSLTFQRKISISTLIMFTIIGVSFYIFSGDIQETQSTREKDFSSEQIQEEGRILEYLIYFDERIKDFSFKTVFGEHLFNNIGEFGINNQYGFYTRERMLHSDYTKLLYGAGVFGLFLLFSVYYKIVKYVRQISNRLKRLKLNKSHVYLIYSYLIVLLISQAIDGMFVFWARGLPLMIIGYLIGSTIETINHVKKKRIDLQK